MNEVESLDVAGSELRPIAGLDDALLNLQSCLVDPSKAPVLIDALGTWLTSEADAYEIPKFEVHSQRVWQLLSAQAQHNPEHRDQSPQPAANHEAWPINSLLVPVSGRSSDPALDLYLNTEDLKRAKAWMQEDRARPLVVRLFPSEPNPLDLDPARTHLALISAIPAGFARADTAVATWYVLEPALGGLVQDVLKETFGLSNKQMETLSYLALGYSRKQVAAAMSIKESTVKTHCESLAERLGAQEPGDMMVTIRQIAASLESHDLKKSPQLKGSEREGTLTLADGEVVSFASYGPSTGRPALYIHGLLAGRHLPRPIEAQLEQTHVRLIALCRPGAGASTLRADCATTYKMQVIRQMAQVVRALDLDRQGPLPIVADGTGLIYALAFARNHPGLCGKVIALDPLPPVLAQEDLQQYQGLFQKMMATNLVSRSVTQAMIQICYEDLRNAATPEDFFASHYFRDMSDPDNMPPVEDRDARWANVQENLAGKLSYVVFDADLMKTDYACFGEGSNLRPPITVLQTDNSPYLQQGVQAKFAQTLGAPLVATGPTVPYVQGQMSHILSALRDSY